VDDRFGRNWLWQSNSPKMLEGWRAKVAAARRLLDDDRRAEELAAVTFTAEETLEFLRRFYGEK